MRGSAQLARALQRFLTTTPTLNPALSLRVTPAPTPTPTVQVWFQNKRARERKALGPQASEHLRRRSTKDGTFPFRTLAVVQPGAEISLVEVLASEILALTRALTLIVDPDPDPSPSPGARLLRKDRGARRRLLSREHGA